MKTRLAVSAALASTGGVCDRFRAGGSGRQRPCTGSRTQSKGCRTRPGQGNSTDRQRCRPCVGQRYGLRGRVGMRHRLRKAQGRGGKRNAGSDERCTAAGERDRLLHRGATVAAVVRQRQIRHVGRGGSGLEADRKRTSCVRNKRCSTVRSQVKVLRVAEHRPGQVQRRISRVRQGNCLRGGDLCDHGVRKGQGRGRQSGLGCRQSDSGATEGHSLLRVGRSPAVIADRYLGREHARCLGPKDYRERAGSRRGESCRTAIRQTVIGRVAQDNAADAEQGCPRVRHRKRLRRAH